MITKITHKTKDEIITNVRKKFNVDIEEDIIDFLQDFQSKIFVEKGFANKKTVRFFNLAVFKYNEKRVDSKITMSRLLNKHNGDSKKALKEFRQLGKVIAIEEEEKKKEEKENRVIRPKRHDGIVSTNGMFTAL